MYLLDANVFIDASRLYYAPDAKKRVLIPDACNAMKVPYRNPFDVYRELKLRFK